MSVSEQDAHHAPVPAVEWHGGGLHQISQGALMEGRIASEGLGCKITHLSPGLCVQGIHSRHYGLDLS
jgi:hypothetical protein